MGHPVEIVVTLPHARSPALADRVAQLFQRVQQLESVPKQNTLSSIVPAQIVISKHTKRVTVQHAKRSSTCGSDDSAGFCSGTGMLCRLRCH
jgi:hypothetical protein